MDLNKIHLSHRTNINTKITSNGDVVIYEDHRTILNVLFLKKINNELEFPVNIFLFDFHDDACVPSSKAIEKIKQFNEHEPTVREFWSFTEFDLRGLDDDWVKAGMELGLINNVFLFNTKSSRIYFLEEYKTNEYGTKKIYNLGDVWDCISNRGYLNDRIKIDSYGELWDDFGWKYDGKTNRFNFEPDFKFIVDFDLDCFSTEILDKTVSIPQDILYDKFQSGYSKDYHYFYNAQSFVKELIEKSDLTTICFENQFCGGFKEAFKIFNYINDLFFDNEI